MPIDVVCHQCRKTLRVGDHVAGKKIRCPACQGVVAVPAEEVVEIAEVDEEPEQIAVGELTAVTVGLGFTANDTV